MAIMITIVMALILCSLTAFFSYRYTKAAFNSIDKILDDILNKNTELPQLVADSRISKLENKKI